MFFNYRVVLQAMLDKRNGDYVTEIVGVDKFDNDNSVRNRAGQSSMRFFYPKEKRADKYKIKVLTVHNEKKKLRSVMSGRRLIKFIFLKKLALNVFRLLI